MDLKKIWSYTRRLLAIIPSIFICALGVALLVWPEWGCDPLKSVCPMYFMFNLGRSLSYLRESCSLFSFL